MVFKNLKMLYYDFVRGVVLRHLKELWMIGLIDLLYL